MRRRIGFGSALLGILLAHGGGFAPESVRLHMWSAIVLTILTILCTHLRLTRGDDGLYPPLLVAAILLTLWTGHQGGTITYGKGYLTRFAPSSFNPLPRRRAYPPVDPLSVYAPTSSPFSPQTASPATAQPNAKVACSSTLMPTSWMAAAAEK